MVDGAASLMTMTYTLRAAGSGTDDRGTNLLDTGAHFYEVYETSDGGYMGVGAIEPQFYAELIRLLGPGGRGAARPDGPEPWPAMKERFAAIFATRTRGRVGGDLRGERRLCRPGAVPGRGARPSPQPAPGHLHRGRRRGPARAVASVRRHPGSIRRPPPNPGPARRRSAGRLGGRARRRSPGSATSGAIR